MSKLNYSIGAVESVLGKGSLISINKPKGEEVKFVEPVTHILVFDRSGSMYNELKGLVTDIKRTIRTIPENDGVEVYWYSGHNQFAKIVSSKNVLSELDTINTTLDKFTETVGCTVFSQVLEEIYSSISAKKDDKYSITFFTDGCLCGDTKSKVMTAIDKLAKADNVLGFNTVGYGNYYDKDLLVSMTSAFSLGNFNHTTEITDFSALFTEFSTEISEGESTSVVITSDATRGYLFTNAGTKSCTFPLRVRLLPKGGLRLLVPEGNTITITEGDEVVQPTTKKVTDTSIVKTLYGLVAELFINNERTEAQDIAEFDLKDGKLMNTMNSAFTIKEIGETYKVIKKFYNNAKFREPGSISSLDYNKPSVFELLTDLKTVDAVIVIKDTLSDGYNKISRTVSDDGSFEFIPERKDQNPKPSTSNIEFSGSSFNVSIGNVYYTGRANGVDCSVIRKYNIINDGALNTKKLTVEFKSAIDATKFASRYNFGTTIINPTTMSFDLSELPIINRQFSKAYEFVRDLVKPITDELNVSIEKKILNYFKNQNKSTTVVNTGSGNFMSVEDMKEKSMTYYAGVGLVYNGFKPEPVSDENTDVAYRRMMDFNLKGFTSLPKVEEIIDYKPAGSRVSEVKSYMNKIYNDLNNLCIATTKSQLSDVNSPEVLKFINAQLAKLKLINTDLLNQVKFVKGASCSLFKDLVLPEDPDKKSFEVEVAGQTILVKLTYLKTYL